MLVVLMVCSCLGGGLVYNDFRRYTVVISGPCSLIAVHTSQSQVRVGIFRSTWADHLIPGLIFFPGNYNT